MIAAAAVAAIAIAAAVAVAVAAAYAAAYAAAAMIAVAKLLVTFSSARLVLHAYSLGENSSLDSKKWACIIACSAAESPSTKLPISIPHQVKLDSLFLQRH